MDTNNEIETTGSTNYNNEQIGFLPAVVEGYKELPTTINVIIFGTLSAVIGWIVITTFIPTVNSGS